MLAIAIPVILAAAAFFPANAAVFSFALAAALWSIPLLGLRNGAIAAPLILAPPLLLRTFSFSFPLRVALLALFGAMIFWFLSDVRARGRGAPLRFERHTFFVSAAAFAFFSVAFVLAAQPSVHAWSLLLVVSSIAAVGSAAMRGVAERASGATARDIPLQFDAAVIGMLIAESFTALSFLPLSPLTLGGVLTICFWVASVILIAARLGELTRSRVLRVASAGTLLVIAIFLSVPWIALP